MEKHSTIFRKVDEFAMKKQVTTKVDRKSLEKVANAISKLLALRNF